jgi:hypothetical protein
MGQEAITSVLVFAMSEREDVWMFTQQGGAMGKRGARARWCLRCRTEKLWGSILYGMESFALQTGAL